MTNEAENVQDQCDNEEAASTELSGAPSSEQPREEDVQGLAKRALEGELDKVEQERVGQILSVKRQYSGPYPPADEMIKYPEWVQKEICWLTRSYHEHQKEIDWFDRKSAAGERKRGQIFGLVVAIAGFVAAFGLSFTSTATAIIVGALDILGLVTAFVYPRYLDSKRQESPEKPDE